MLDRTSPVSASIAKGAILYRMDRDTEPPVLFPTDSPVPHAMIGRAADVDRLTTLLGQGLNQVVVGPRRQGKTTVCQASLSRLRNKGYYTVEIDLFAVPDLERLADILVAGAVSNRSTLRRAARGAYKGSKHAASAVLSAAASAKLLSEFGIGVQLAFSPPRVRREDPLAYFQHAIRLLDKIAERDDKRLVLFIDEFQEIAAAKHRYGDPDEVMQMMRAELQISPRVTTLFAGSMEHMMRDLFGKEHRALYRWGAYFDVAEISERSWRAGISRRMNSVGLSFSPGGLEKLIQYGERQARTTMLIAQQAYILARTEAKTALDPDLIDVAFEVAGRADALAHEVTVRAVRQGSRHAFEVLLRIASGLPPYQGKSHASVAQRAIDALRDEGLIAHGGTEHRSGWVVVDPLLRRYLLNLEA